MTVLYKVPTGDDELIHPDTVASLLTTLTDDDIVITDEGTVLYVPDTISYQEVE